jgi:hypothetical protein
MMMPLNEHETSSRRNSPKGTAMSNTRYRGACVALAILTLSSVACDLEVLPTESVGPETATGSVAGVEALLTGVYNRLQEPELYGNELLLLPEVMADAAFSRIPTNSYQNEFRNQIGAHMGDWEIRYLAINEANFVIASAAELNAPQATKDRLIGEASFLRAINYFDLARVYAYEPTRIVNGWDRGVVLRTEPTRTASDAEFRARATVQETYELIENDLLRSIELLGTAGGDNVFFATAASAEALLARVYLYWERWSDAIAFATRAMEHTTARLAEPDEYATIFARAPNPEAVFEINYDPATESLWVNDCPACFTHPTGTWFSLLPTDELLSLYEPGDARLAIYPTTSTGITYINKYTNARGANTDNSPVIRYSELLLIRAEAYAQSGQEALARADLTTLRAKRNVGPITANGAALLETIMDERQRELAFEGHRWFDLKRRGMDITKPETGLNPTVPYSDFRILAGLPTNQVQNNPLLEQNPGY